MKIIKGERFQELCDIHISKLEHKKFEADVESIDVDNYNFLDFDNPELVYCNISLFNSRKPKLVESNIWSKLKLFKNPFKLVLHNADDFIIERHMKQFKQIPNCKKVYSVNPKCKDDMLVPLPIGQANWIWDWGSHHFLENSIKTEVEKTNLVYANFTQSDKDVIAEHRELVREKCYNSVLEQDIPFVSHMRYEDYLETLKTYKYCISPQGTGIDCYRMWEALYLKVVPICERSILVEHFAETFPIKIVDDWDDFDVSTLEDEYDKYTWENYDLLDFDNYVKEIGLV